MNDLITLLPLITIFIVFYALLYIPQRRRNKKHREFIDDLQIGDNVITESGIHGRVTTINKKTPAPKTIISFFINVIMSSAIIGIPPRCIFIIY